MLHRIPPAKGAIAVITLCRTKLGMKGGIKMQADCVDTWIYPCIKEEHSKYEQALKVTYVPCI